MHSSRRSAPAGLIQRDFNQIESEDRLRTTWDVERLIFIQSIQGHAHEGHSIFHGTRYPSTSIDDISRALHLDPAWVRSERQRLIDDISQYADKVMAGDDHAPLANEDGEGFLGSSVFRAIEAPGHEVLRGLYLGGLRDSPEVRFPMESKYGVTIGGGKSYLVNTRVMEDLRLNEEILAHGAHEDMIDYYKDRGLIVGDSGPDGGEIQYLYIRLRRGPGASDDTAIIAAGLLYGLGTAVGVFLADAIDTLEKYVPVYSDQDHDLARRIQANYPSLGITDAELMHLTYLSAQPLESDFPVPDCSLRYMMRIDRKYDLTPLESHFLFIQGKPVPAVHIGHENVLNRDLYQYVRARMKNSPEPL